MGSAGSNPGIRRFLVFFPLCLLAGFALLEVPLVAGWVARFTGSLVDVSGALIHLFGGKALVAGGGRPWYDAEQLWVPLLEQPRPLFQASGSLRLPSGPSTAGEPPEQWAFDGREPGCVWHRLVLDACLPAGTSVLVESRAADTRGALFRADQEDLALAM